MQHYDENGNKIGSNPPTISQIISFNLLIVSVLIITFTVCLYTFGVINCDEKDSILTIPIILLVIGFIISWFSPQK